MIGRSAGWDTARLGGSALGRGTIVGRPEPAVRLGLSGIGVDARVG
jgi:hypothetical protein